MQRQRVSRVMLLIVKRIYRFLIVIVHIYHIAIAAQRFEESSVDREAVHSLDVCYVLRIEVIAGDMTLAPVFSSLNVDM